MNTTTINETIRTYYSTSALAVNKTPDQQKEDLFTQLGWDDQIFNNMSVVRQFFVFLRSIFGIRTGKETILDQGLSSFKIDSIYRLHREVMEIVCSDEFSKKRTSAEKLTLLLTEAHAKLPQFSKAEINMLLCHLTRCDKEIKDSVLLETKEKAALWDKIVVNIEKGEWPFQRIITPEMAQQYLMNN